MIDGREEEKAFASRKKAVSVISNLQMMFIERGFSYVGRYEGHMLYFEPFDSIRARVGLFATSINIKTKSNESEAVDKSFGFKGTKT
jgi:hypothetical protein